MQGRVRVRRENCERRWTRHGKKHGKAQARRNRYSVFLPSCALSACLSATSLSFFALACPRLQTVCVGNATFLKLQPHTNLHLPRERVCFVTVWLSFLFSLLRVGCSWTTQNTFAHKPGVPPTSFLYLFRWPLAIPNILISELQV